MAENNEDVKKENEDVKKTKLDEYFQNICNDNPLEKLSKFICPSLVGDEWKKIRQAGLLTLVTGSDNTTRMRLHMLLDGKPGTGKSIWGLWWRENLQGILINAELTSKTGLVGDARGSKITAGLLADYTGNIVICDELDKMSLPDTNGLLQSMEEGQYTIVKGKHRETFKAEVRIIGNTNKMGKLQKPLLDRFDFIYTCKTASRDDRVENVGRIVDTFMGNDDIEYGKIIRGYIGWLGNYSPKILPKNRDKVVGILKKYIREVKDYEVEKVSYRSLELSCLRIAWAMAKLKKTNIGTQEMIDAIIFKNDILRRIYGVKL